MQSINLSRYTLPVLIFVLITYIPGQCQAQSVIRGMVLNTYHEPAMNTSVPLLHSKDSSLVEAMICDKSSTYSFSNVGDGSFLTATNSLEYMQAFSSVFLLDKVNWNATVAAIVLTEEQSFIEDVDVAAKKPLIEQTIDRLIINRERFDKMQLSISNEMYGCKQ